MDQHATPMVPLANTNVRLSVGADSYVGDTDVNGMVTFIYDAPTDFANQPVVVQLTDASRAWQGSGNAGMATHIAIPVAGEFRLTVELYMHKPGTGAIQCPSTWASLLELQTTSASALRDCPLACETDHTLTVGLASWLPTSTVEISIDGHRSAINKGSASHADVTWHCETMNQLRLQVTRHAAQVCVRFCFHFHQVLVVGEGVGFEYTMGLASKYADPRGHHGFRWIIASQYDVTDIASLPRKETLKDWKTGQMRPNLDLKQLVQAACNHNLINHGQKFDATDAAHWTAAEKAYGRFDAVIFNNPHPGYGLHMCEVLGLAAAQAPYSKKNGRAISVYSFGYQSTLTQAQLRNFKSAANPRLFSVQRKFVRGNATAELDYRNGPNQAIASQYDPTNTTRSQLDVHTAFRYENSQPIDQNVYGTSDESCRDQEQYCSVVDTLGLQQFLLRCYRYYGPTVLKRGGSLYVNGSNQWAHILTTEFDFKDGETVTHIAAMHNVGKWWSLALPHEYFVHYRSNFTSTLHHPSWYSDPDFAPAEPNIKNATVYEIQV
jgi:hypothetical protein